MSCCFMCSMPPLQFYPVSALCEWPILSLPGSLKLNKILPRFCQFIGISSLSKDIFVPYLGLLSFTTSPVTHYFFPQVYSVACTIPWRFPELVILFQAATFSLCSFPCLVNSLSLLFFACSFSKPSWGNILLSCWHWFFSLYWHGF